MSSPKKSSPKTTDVVVVGARIAGASLAIHLARAGFSVTLVDRAKFPSDTLSTHLIQVSGVRCMQQLGVLDELVNTGAPFLTAMRPIYDGISLDSVVQAHEDWPPGGVSINRNLLDKILIDVAEKEGVEVRLRTTVTGVRKDITGRVTGVELRGGETLGARLVIGADGRNSKVSELVGARTYNVTANQRFVYWADYEGAVEPGPAAVHHYRSGPDLTLGFRSDSGRFTVMVSPGLDEFAAFKSNLPESFDNAVAACEPLKPFIADATRVGGLTGTAYVPGYFRDSAGPGWALVGDSGHFKDPTVGQGISDALRQAEKLAGFIAGANLHDRAATDRALQRWWRWRDRDATPMYWLAWDLAKAGPMAPLERELLRCISANPVLRHRFVDEVLSHRASPYAVLTPALMLKAAAGLLRRGELNARQTAALIGERVKLEIQRQWLLRRPKYAPLPKPPGKAARDGDAWAGDIRHDDLVERR
ncbi:2-polyprenyl-6-methoxyphenol hydroxylase [Amycolatopsis xylanica]|uniref:2-polyprenyl-6-methoxyphenol hydroxylase n=1 Tax=Amycolatopsis xylanica TaxID=589385 RepID=A0A1H3PGI5_9PSEU|nr:NAD(P)/FAD-dependent oxidoreductase [Amycolatopsis xylanica]SDZ00244.1 2-polyprenyl-6-methoxyphenol hydroxylase [Amycolatopsis xylanica]